MNVTYLNPPTIPAPAAAYTHSVKIDLGSGALLYVSGQVALDEDQNVVGEGDMAAQTEYVFAQLRVILEAHGGTLADIVNVHSFLTDMDLLPEHGRVRRALITGTPPTSTAVEVSRLFRPGLLVEVDVVAALPHGGTPRE